MFCSVSNDLAFVTLSARSGLAITVAFPDKKRFLESESSYLYNLAALGIIFDEFDRLMLCRNEYMVQTIV